MLEKHNEWAKTRLTPQKFAKRLKANDIETVRARIDGVQGAGIIGYIFNEVFINNTECKITPEKDA
jgi:hypothetical protein